MPNIGEKCADSSMNQHTFLTCISLIISRIEMRFFTTRR